FSSVSPRPLRRVQSRLGSRHAVRLAIGWAHRSDPVVDAAPRTMALRLDARAGDARSGPLPQFSCREGLARWLTILARRAASISPIGIWRRRASMARSF